MTTKQHSHRPSQTQGITLTVIALNPGIDRHQLADALGCTPKAASARVLKMRIWYWVDDTRGKYTATPAGYRAVDL